jgi:hypothetical protein
MASSSVSAPRKMPLTSIRDGYEESPDWVTGGKTLNEYMFSELPQVADIVRSAGSLRTAKDRCI